MHKKLFHLIALCLVAAWVSSCQKEDDSIPGFSSIDVSTTTNSTAYILGGFSQNGKNKGVLISETPNVTESSATSYTYTDIPSSENRFKFFVQNLYANTTYYFKVYYTDNLGNKVYSPEMNFKTTYGNYNMVIGLPVDSDTLVSEGALYKLTYKVNPDGARTAEYGICYSKDTQDPRVDSKIIAGTFNSTIGIATCDMSSLSFEDTMYVRPYVKTEKGISYGTSGRYAKSKWVTCGSGSPTRNPGVFSDGKKCFFFSGYLPSNSNTSAPNMWSFNSETLGCTSETSLEKIFASYPWPAMSMKSVQTKSGFLFFKGSSIWGDSYNLVFSYDVANKWYTQVLTNGISNDVLRYSWGSDGFNANGTPYVVFHGGRTSIPNGISIYSYNESTKAFNLETNNQERLGETGVTLFNLGNDIYVGSGTYNNFSTNQTSDFWTYNVTTKVWKQLKNCPVKKAIESFTYKNRCFALDDDKKLYEYKPSDDSWTVIDTAKENADALFAMDNGIYLITTKHIGGDKSAITSYKTYIKKYVLL